MILIKTIDELKKYLKVDNTFQVPSIDAYQDLAIEKYLREALGDQLTVDLVTHYNADPETEDEDLDKLLPYAARVVANFAFLMAGPNMDLKLMDAGFTVHSSENLAPASKERVNRLLESLERNGWDAVEQLLRFLEANKSKYEAWTSSEAYTLQVRNFINSAEEFDKFVNIGKSRLKFKELRIAMDNVEILEVVPVISQELADDIKDKIKDGSELSAFYDKLVDKLKRAVANLTAAAEIDPKYKKTGDHYLGEVRKYLDGNVEEFPLYRDSGLYVAGKTYEKFENSEDNSFFVAGG